MSTRIKRGTDGAKRMAAERQAIHRASNSAANAMARVQNPQATVDPNVVRTAKSKAAAWPS